MTVTLTFQPEIEANLLAKARASGMGLQEYLQRVVEREATVIERASMQPDATRREEAVRRMLEFGERHQLSFGKPITRALLHEEHRY